MKAPFLLCLTLLSALFALQTTLTTLTNYDITRLASRAKCGDASGWMINNTEFKVATPIRFMRKSSI